MLDRLNPEGQRALSEMLSLNPVSAGLVVSVAWPCFYDGSLLGLVGLDIHAADLLEGVTYFNSPDRNTYAFLVDYRGILSVTITVQNVPSFG